MRYQFIDQYKQEFPVIVMCRVLDVSRSVAITPGASAYPVSASEKMLNSSKTFNRCLTGTREDMVLHTSTENSKSRSASSHANGWPGSCERSSCVPSVNVTGCAPRDASGGSEYLQSGIYGNSAEYQMGHRYHVHSYGTRDRKSVV